MKVWGRSEKGGRRWPEAGHQLLGSEYNQRAMYRQMRGCAARSLGEAGLHEPCVTRFTATALIVREDRVLLGKRTSRERFAKMWDAFGGHREEGETPAHALVRELFEELGIRVTKARFLHEYEDRDPTSREMFHHHLYLVTGWKGEPRVANPEHSEIRWFRTSEVAKLKLMPHLRKTVREVLPENV